MPDLLDRVRAAFTDDAAQWFAAAMTRRRSDGTRSLRELLPQVPRRVGRATLGGGRLQRGDAIADLDAWRVCDGVAWCLLQRDAAPDDLEVDLYQHGDLEERTMVLRALSLLPVRAATVALLAEIQRTNVVAHFEAGVCDSNLVARARQQGLLAEPEFNRLLLKLAFLDLPLCRAFAAETGANDELSRMLQGLASEREAAGRSVWSDTSHLIGRQPVAGSAARLVGYLEHGDDRHRLAAATAIAQLNRPLLLPFVVERIPREPREDIRALLTGAASHGNPAP